MNPTLSRPGPAFGDRLARASLAVLAISAGGVFLGSLLAYHANPVPLPRAQPDTAWERMFRPQDIQLDQTHLWFEAPPIDLQPGWQSSYRPDIDYDTVVTGWAPPPLPEWDDPAPSAKLAAPAEPVPAPIDHAADAAVQAAADARSAATVSNPAPPAAPPAAPAIGTAEEPRGLW